jgi:ribosomal protein L11 methyltransferase
MSRYKLSMRVAELATARAAAMALEELITPAAHATSLFEERSAFRVEAYYGEQPDPGGVLGQLASILAPAKLPTIDLVEVPAENWVRVSQAALPPVTAGRFTIFGSHDRARIPRGPSAIQIDAGEAFGTAHHATTQGCLMAIDRLAPSSRRARLLDLGCGSGVLAIALARRFPHAEVIASDMDPIAVAVAEENARLNGVGQRIRFEIAAGLARPGLFGPFDAIVANILAGPLITLAPTMRLAAASGSTIVLSGILTPQAPSVIASYRAQNFYLADHRRIAGWSTLTLVRG